MEKRPIAPEYTPSADAAINLYRLRSASLVEARNYLKQIKLPRYLYRFENENMPDEWLKDQIINSYYYLRSRDDFNDPYDTSGKVIINLSPSQKRQKIESIVKNSNPRMNWKNRRITAQKHLLDGSFDESKIQFHLNNNVRKAGILCFSENVRQLLMWSHYATQHKGFAFQFETCKDILNFTGAWPLNYTDEFPIYNWGGDFEEVKSILLNKYSAWSYEQERRIIRINGAHTYLRINPISLSGVIYGARTNKDTISRVENYLRIRERKFKYKINRYIATLHPGKYKMLINHVFN